MRRPYDVDLVESAKAPSNESLEQDSAVWPRNRQLLLAACRSLVTAGPDVLSAVRVIGQTGGKSSAEVTAAVARMAEEYGLGHEARVRGDRFSVRLFRQRSEKR
jgi:hypothetical protein